MYFHYTVLLVIVRSIENRTNQTSNLPVKQGFWSEYGYETAASFLLRR